MKKEFSFILIIFFVVSISSCSSQNESPEEVLEQYVSHLSEGNCEEAIKISTGEAQEGAKYHLENGCQRHKQEVLSVQCSEENNFATCEIRIKKDSYLNHPEGTYNYTYTMQKVKDNWKVLDQWKSLNYSEEQIKEMSQTE